MSVDSTQVLIDLGSSVTLSEIIRKKLNPNENITHTLGLSISKNQTSYICAEVTSFLKEIEDSDLSNNTNCITPSERSIVVSQPFPNPVRGILNLQVVTDEDREFLAELINSRGQTVFTENIRIVKGLNKLMFDVSKLEGGIYLLKTQNSLRVYRLMIDN